VKKEKGVKIFQGGECSTSNGQIKASKSKALAGESTQRGLLQPKNGRPIEVISKCQREKCAELKDARSVEAGDFAK